MTATDIWMPIYIGDYLADTMALEARGHGAYLLLLMHYWKAGPLPDDDRQLATIARVDRRAWATGIGAAVRSFFQARDGRLHQARLDGERAAASQNREKKVAAAQVRWGGQGVRGPFRHPPAADAPDAARGDIPGAAHGDTSDAARGDASHAARGDACDAARGDAPASAPAPAPHDRAACPSPSPSSLRSDSPLPLVEDGAAPAAGGRDADDPRLDLFRRGLAELCRLTGHPAPRARALIGKWLQQAGDDAGRVLAAIDDAAARRPAGPVAWIEAALRHRAAPPSRFSHIDRERWRLRQMLAQGSLGQGALAHDAPAHAPAHAAAARGARP